MEDKGRHVLCVEDNTDNQLLLKLYLKKHPWEITFAQDGIGAMELLNKGRYDLFLVDLSLPNGMDGIKVAKRIRQNSVHKDKPIVVISAYSKSDITLPPNPPHIDQYLTKPIRKADFIELLEKYL